MDDVERQAHEDCLAARQLYLDAGVRYHEAYAAAVLAWHLPLARQWFLVKAWSAVADSRAAAALFRDAARRLRKARLARRDQRQRVAR